MSNPDPYVCVRVTYRHLLGARRVSVNLVSGATGAGGSRRPCGSVGTNREGRRGRRPGRRASLDAVLPPVLGLSLALDERGLAPGISTRVHLVAEVTAL